MSVDQPPELVGMVLVLAGVCVMVLLLTIGWIQHNRRLAEKGDRGRATPYRVPQYDRDAIGRTVALDLRDRHSARVVRIDSDAERKFYSVESRGRS